MAIAVRFEDGETTAVYSAAYCKIDPASIRVDFQAEHVEFEVAVYVGKIAAATGRARVARLRIILDGSDFRRWFGDPATSRLYDYLKTLPKFDGAVDA